MTRQEDEGETKLVFGSFLKYLSLFQLLGHLLWAAKRVAQDQGLDKTGYRLGKCLFRSEEEPTPHNNQETKYV